MSHQFKPEDLNTVSVALHTGQASARKVDAQRAWSRVQLELLMLHGVLAAARLASEEAINGSLRSALADYDKKR